MLITAFLCCSVAVDAQQVDYSVVSVSEESGMEFMKITNSSDYVCMPEVRRNGDRIDWLSNRILDISTEGKTIAYLSFRNNSTNIFLKDLRLQGGSVQRTNRSAVIDFSYSPDGRYLCFSEMRGDNVQIFQTDAVNGYACRQITSGANDYSPVYSADQKQIFFSRMESRGASVWSYNVDNNFLSSFSSGKNPFPLSTEPALVLSRISSNGRSEIWKINYVTGVEECIASDAERSFTSPIVSPDGRWILFVGDNSLKVGTDVYRNTDLFACRIDGSAFVQLTYHAADDLSPVWSNDGYFIYFISQRGDSAGVANIWRMTFNVN